MRIVPCLFVLACLLIAPSGCSLFGKKDGSSGEGGAFMGASGDKNKPLPPNDPLTSGIGAGGDFGGLITGQVIDSIGRPADAQISWSCLDEPKEEPAAIEVAVDRQGYFQIQGLKSGKHYKLIVRAKSGDRTIEKVYFTQAPNVKVLIQMDEKFVVPNPPPSGKSIDKGKKSASKATEQPASVQVPAGPPPGWQQQPTQGALPPAPGFDNSRQVQEQAFAVKPPLADTTQKPPQLPAGGGSWQTQPGGPPITIAAPVQGAQFSVPAGPTPVPSCVRIGKRIENFALNDISLTPWELKANRRGKLMLLDFWKTNCPPCIQAIPTLRILQDKYGPYGLEVVGIAYEDGGTLVQQADKVTKVGQYRETNYVLLLGGGAKCPVKRDLEVTAYPTMILLDESGTVLWRHVGSLDRPQLDDLDHAIKKRLVE